MAGGGGGGNASVTVEAIQPDAAQVLGLDAATEYAEVYQQQVDYDYEVQTADVEWKSVLAGLIGTYSIIQQYNLNERQVDLAERSVDIAEEYKDLAIQNYNEIIKVAFTKSCTYWDHYVTDLQQYENDFLTDAFEHDEYTPDFAAQKGRAIAGVQRSFDVAEKAAMRLRGPYATGACCDLPTRMAIARARATSAAINTTFRYEDAKKVELDQQYFQRKTAGMSVLAGISGLAGGMLNGAAAGSVAGLNAIGNAVQAGNEAYGQIANAYASQGDFWGSIGQGAFGFLGYSGFDRSGWGIIQQPTMSAPSSVVTRRTSAGPTSSMRPQSRPQPQASGGKFSPSGLAIADPVVTPNAPMGYSLSTGTFF